MIFVDTGAWFTLAVDDDADHKAATAWLQGNREPLLTTDYVLAETATLIRVRDKTQAFAFDSHFDEYAGVRRLPRQ